MKTFILFLAFTSLILPQQWENQNPHFSTGDVRGIEFINKEIGFIVIGYTIYRTENGGETLDSIFTLSTYYNSVKIEYLDSTLIIFDNTRILKSTDLGDSFLDYPMNFQSFEVGGAFFLNKNVAWVWSSSPAIRMRITTDGGSTWAATTSNLSGGIYDVFFIDPLNGFATFGNVQSSFLKTTDGGYSWLKVTIPISIYHERITFITKQIGFIGRRPHMYTNDGGNTWVLRDTFAITHVKNNTGIYININSENRRLAYITNDYGENWKEFILPTHQFRDVFDLADSTTIFNGSLKGALYKSTNSGKNWGCITSPTFQLHDVQLIDDNYAFAAGTNNMRTSDGGENWEILFGEGLSAIYFLNNRVGVGVSAYRNSSNDPEIELKRTSDFGINWETIVKLSGSLSMYNNFYFRDSLNGYLILSTKMLKTTDGGITWQFNDIENINGIHFLDSNIGYMTSLFYGYQTLDGGNSWFIKPELRGDNIFFIDTLVGFKTDYYQLQKTTDGGDTFYDLINHGQSDWFNDLKFYNETNGIVKFCYHNEILKTTNTGETWEKIFPFEGLDIENFAISFPSFNKGLAVGLDCEIFKYTAAPIPVELTTFTAKQSENSVLLNWSTATEINNREFEIQKSKDGGEWFLAGSIKGSGTTTEPREYTFFDKDVSYGKYRYKLIQIDFDGTRNEQKTIEIEVNNLPKNFALYQNYPNPFNPTTVIKYTIPSLVNSQSSIVNLKVYDILGNEVAVLVNETKQPGDYEVTFDASRFSSGVYFYKLSAAGGAGSFTAVKKMTVIK